MISLDKGSVSKLSTKQKINGKSSTEGKLIGVDSNMSQILWSIYSIEAQGYNIAHN